MASFKASDIHRQAQNRLQQAAAPKRLVLIHTLVALGTTLLIAGVNYLFSLLIADTGGLSGMGARSILSTVQTLLEMTVIIALPFWQIGLTFLALCWAQNVPTETDGLLYGFRQFKAVLVFRILYGLVFLVFLFAAANLSSIILLVTPFSNPLLDEISPLMDPANAAQIDALLSPDKLADMLNAMIPLLVIFGVVFLVIAIPVFYRLRLGEFALMDGFSSSNALLYSFRLTKGNWRHLVRLDLHFWWFYVLLLLCNVIGNGNLLLPLLGISLPIGEDGAYFLFFILGTALQILLFWQCRAAVLTSYAVVYDTLSQPQTESVSQ